MTDKKQFATYLEIEETKDINQKEKYWKTGFGLNKIDYLEPSTYLTQDLLPEHLAGKLSYQEVENALVNHYQALPADEQVIKERECDIVSTRIASLLDNSGFVLSPASLKGIHRYLFKNILPVDWIGSFRQKNIYKKEPILNGESVSHANYFMIEDTLTYDFEMEKKKNYVNMTALEKIQNIAGFASSIWQVHPFREGNTRTVAVFMVQYLNVLGFQVNNDPFEDNALYFRNALVRSNYSNQVKNISHTDAYLIKFFENLLFDQEQPLSNQEMQLIDEYEKENDWELEM
ncbi:Fic/DOC family protein [Acetobacterium woodii]|uniref:protein adenylyltransferase n=1 Tax=Acetobacterium woodii (strain ATCC 29683 / DSM 1030 / JCM 2381 / KCTC 1655 / WB1) TaxID=931626 RepID=H6LDH0_ACEWD|nr:Fic family protein [Acetobacterium woodii]AFA47942.1 filamentation protein Fic2 [Acetobacterium woodii DSM 1030]